MQVQLSDECSLSIFGYRVWIGNKKVKKNSEYIIYPLKYPMYFKLLHSTMSYSAAVTSGTVRRCSICYVVHNSSCVTLGQNLIYKEENIDRVLPLVNFFF